MLLYTHFFSFWILIVQCCITLWQWKTSNRMLVLGFSITAIFYLPYMSVLATRIADSGVNGTWIPAPNGIWSLLDMLRLFSNEAYGTVNFYGSKPIITVVFIGLGLLGTIKGLRRVTREERIVHWAIIAWFALPFSLMWVASFIVPMFHDRYLVFASVAYILLISIGLNALIDQHRLRNFMMCGAAICFLFTCTADVSNKRDIQSTVAQIKTLRKQFPTATVLICPEWYDLNFMYYWDRLCFEPFPSTSPMTIKQTVHACLKADKVFLVQHVKMVLELGLSPDNHVIYLDAGAEFSNPSNGISAYLTSTFKHIERYDYPEIFRVYHCHN